MMRFLQYLERSRRAGSLSGVATGDFILLIAFAVIGRWSHHELSVGGLWRTLGTAAPFLVGWGVTAPSLGAYEPRAFRTYGSALSRLLAVWPIALIVALIIRSVVEREIPAFAFILVALLFNLLTLSLWRVVVVTVRRGRL
jgi:Protein of unknown function (DUF3054)